MGRECKNSTVAKKRAKLVLSSECLKLLEFIIKQYNQNENLNDERMKAKHLSKNYSICSEKGLNDES
jgi:hypothetical protein